MNYDIVKRKIQEVSYLNTERTVYYRSLLRFFYEEYKKYRVLLNTEELLGYMKEVPGFNLYSMEDLKQDLDTLVGWGNLEPHLDKGKVMKLEDFRQRRFMYRATEYTIGYEAATKKLEMERSNGSLSISLVDRLLGEIKRLSKVEVSLIKSNAECEDLVQTWDDVFERFKRLMKEIGDYLSHVNSLAFEKKIMEDNETYISFKNKFINYVQRFIMAIHEYHHQICQILKIIDDSQLINRIIELVAKEKFSSFNYEESFSFEEVVDELKQEWRGLYHWFVETEGQQTGYSFMISQTRETIPRLVTLAKELNEKNSIGRNRQLDYLQMSRLFFTSDSVTECHQMAAMIFGSRTIKEIRALGRSKERTTETVWEHPPHKVPIMTKERERREKKKKTYVYRDEEAIRKTIKAYEENQKKRQRLLTQLLEMEAIIIRDLGLVDPYIRETLLNWITDAQNNKNWIGRAEGIREFQLVLHSEEKIELLSSDGTLSMSDYELWFTG
ncbi:TIGR02677 family protein [Bacillus sp. PS06]|uniref:TIGR02677 family protein n=1 Tax=Bacillus sp. PS06 TaxID=2764176 RepID=UPI0017829196|nr:TIGR02677 family protein [Bacillus sp. PS06]MBD8069866.1 TIGR02677 family protein [Bacillus sp. PS06]